MNKFDFSRRVRRGTLLASVCAAGLMQVVPALAADGYGPIDPSAVERAAQSDVPIANFLPDVAPDPQIVISNPGTPGTALDPDDVTGIGQMIIDQQNGFIGLCTGTLINPRTVLFAAHCVNDDPANAYGAANGGKPIAFGFSSNNNAPGNSAFGHWLNGYQTNTDDALYNVNYVAYSPLSTEPDSGGYLYGDVATASLDTPAGAIPTWALLFSPLPDPGTIGADGTGYHVQIQGYGNNGSAATGSTGGIDYRRRIANNIVGALASLDDFELFQFYGLKTSDGYTEGLPQNLYWIDFDDPARGTPAEGPFDFNAWRDNAVENEGITASGDSGGPLILDQEFSNPLVIGVLSGGYTAFFDGQPPNGYGTASFYQPLYLYWDWIAANNPYHYVSAKAGDGAWEDSTHWVTNLDPNYYVLTGGQPTNGIPTEPGAGNSDQPGFGQACFESGGFSDCYDVSTGEEYVDQRPIGGEDNDPVTLTNVAASPGGATNGKAVVKFSLDGVDGSSSPAAAGGANGGSADNSAAVAAEALPTPTLLSGLPGASDFVPDNDDGDAPNSVAPRYFDVTLSATGTTTLSSDVTIDRFTLQNQDASLVINSGASLTSLINVSQFGGFMTVNGTLSTLGDYIIVTGGLTGNGTINTPFFTSAAGAIAPGTTTTTGTLTFNGNVILGAGNGYFVNLGANGVSDRIVVNATESTDGIAALDGAVLFSPADGYVVRDGDTYTILTAEGGIDGTFSASQSISAILSPVFTYTANSVEVEIEAGLYADVVTANSPVQGAYAQLLDQSRGNAVLAGVYGALDLQDAATIQATLDSWAPRTETLRSSLATVAADNMSRFYRDRLASINAGDMGGRLAMIGRPVQLAALNMNAMGADQVRTDAGGEVTVQEGRLPETVSGFLAGGYLDGDSRPMATAMPLGGRDQFDGFYIAGGLETALNDSSVIGLSLSYTDIDGNAAVAGQTASGTLIQGTLYGKTQLGGGVELATQLSAGAFDSKTKRIADLVGTPFTLTGADSSLVFTGEVTLGKDFDLGAVEFGPRAGLRASHIGFSDIKENGGGPALHIDRSSFNSVQARAGLALSGKPGASFKPHLRADYVHEFMDAPASFGATFVGGPGPNAIFGLAGGDKDWFELGGGLTVSTGNIDLSVGAETTIARKDVSYQSYRGTVTFHF
ncbi:autotransporter domain-containing protein [Sphingopyxis sp. DBS4]|uniref:autotransporter domain-containing protein n=1 Tax=Sphingopyxis sp. DBS4 TaxID=2968500 RepID=UPI00214C9BB2|nr:autotransporter domain-containing protein [Sphingopyxis sp. DBS4]